jgi:hypothetical protein
MATWKKVIVSGSTAHLLGITASQVTQISDASAGGRVLAYDVNTGAFGYILTSSIVTAAAGGVNSFYTINVGGLGGSTGSVSADSSTDTLIISSSDVNITISATGTTTDTLTFDFADSPSFTNISASGNISIGGDLSVNGNTTLGNAAADTVTITAATVTATNLPIYTAGTHNSVLIQSASNIIAKRDIDSRVWGATLISGSGTANQIAYFNAATGIVGDTGLTYNASTDVLTVNGSTFGQDVTIAGNLTVSGTTTIIDTSNLTVEDKFIILAHGSGSISPIQEGGIIIEGSTGDSGQAFVFNSGSTLNVTGRWGVAAGIHATSSDVTPTEYMVTATSSAVAPSTAPTYGGSSGGYGNIHVNSTDESIWIYS